MPVHILLIEDDNDDYFLTAELLKEISSQRLILDWASSPEMAFPMLASASYDLCLLDYNLGAETGLDVLRELRRRGYEHPVIILTGQDDYDTDVEMMKAGADDYMLKSELTPRSLERSIRYARERHQMVLALRESELRLTDALRKSESRFHRLSDSNMIGIIATTAHGVISEANDAFLSIIGYSSEELIDRQLRWTDITPPEYAAVDAATVREIIESGFHPPYEKEYIRKDGTTVPVLIGMTLLEGTAGEAIGFVMDLSERKRWERETQEAREKAEAANRAKDDFLATLSHELRTPLTPILGALEILSEWEDVPGEFAVYLEMIERNITLEAHLIDDLLDMSRILRGKLPLHLTEVDLRTVVGAALAICERDVQEKQINVSASHADENCLVMGDSARLQQVFWNIIKNAAKFTPAGGEIRIRSSITSDDYCEVSILDTGIGIEQSLLSIIFRPFEQGEEMTNKQFGGLGLGLSITRRLVEMHHGDIWADSAGPGTGSTFTVRIPLLQRSVSAVSVDENEAPPAEPVARQA